MKQAKKKIVVAGTMQCNYPGCTQKNCHNSKYCARHKKVVYDKWYKSVDERAKLQIKKIKEQELRRVAQAQQQYQPNMSEIEKIIKEKMHTNETKKKITDTKR